MKYVGVIPSRFNSTRLPGKPLADIAGKPMIWYVYTRARTVLKEVYVATDDTRIVDMCNKFEIPVLMTSKHNLTGTDRSAELAQHIDSDVYIIIQGDEPLIHKASIKRVYEECKYHNIVNCYSRLTAEEISDINIVKMSCTSDNKIKGFSRGILPTYNYKQIGLYGIHKKELFMFNTLPVSKNEDNVKAEMYRFIDNNFSIKAVLGEPSISVDTVQDLALVRNIIIK
jgi:3-deoxy-manno-octulosonate cytidylyltransferase (CMP-KDO synthetase)